MKLTDVIIDKEFSFTAPLGWVKHMGGKKYWAVRCVDTKTGRVYELKLDSKKLTANSKREDVIKQAVTRLKNMDRKEVKTNSQPVEAK